jgi:hypothetical protein
MKWRPAGDFIKLNFKQIHPAKFYYCNKYLTRSSSHIFFRNVFTQVFILEAQYNF